MSANNGYIGRAPSDSSVIVARQTFNPTGGQTTFTFDSTYDVGYLDAYLNGARLINASDYTAADGSSVVLGVGATTGDILECVAYKAFNLGQTVVGVSSGGTVIKGNDVRTLNFIGTGNTFAVSGNTVDISISGGGGGVNGFATPLSSTPGDFLNEVFVTPRVLTLGAGTSVSITSAAADGYVAFTRVGRVDVGTGSTLHVSVGTTFITNVLGVF